MKTQQISRDDNERLLRRLCREVEQRIGAGESQVVETLISANPELSDDGEAIIELIYTEYLAREELGRPPLIDELRQRFPKWKERLERLLDVDSALSPKTAAPVTIDTGSTWHGHKLTVASTNATTATVGPMLQRIGQYELLEEIGRGGMGVVYRARQLGLNRIVALKVIQTGHTSENQRSRFRAEAEAVALLQHPNIVQVFEIGQQAETHFISLEYAAQGSLDRKLAVGPFGFRAAAETIETLALAAEVAHQHGIIHRDLKPANVLVTKNGILKLTDFGLAKSLLETSQRQTQTGAILGTPCYMSPEQADGRNTDIGPATDVYALGCILYELLTGQPPFVGNTALETLDQIRSREPVSPMRLRKGLPRDLETICLRCLQKDPRRRYGSAKLLAEDARRFLEHEPIKARPIGMIEHLRLWSRRHLPILKLTIVCVLILVFAGVYAAIQSQLVVQLHNDIEQSEHQATRNARIAETSKSEAEKSMSAREAAIDQSRELLDRLVQQSKKLMWHPGTGKIGQPTLELALQSYRNLLKSRPHDPKLKQDAARAFIWAGHFQREYGHYTKAHQHLIEGCEHWRSLTHQFPNELSYQYGLADGLIQMGHLQRFLNQQGRSIRTYRDGVQILEEILRKAPDHVGYLDLLAIALLNMSISVQNLESFEQSEKDIHKAIQIQWLALTKLLRNEMKRHGVPKHPYRIVAPWHDYLRDPRLYSTSSLSFLPQKPATQKPSETPSLTPTAGTAKESPNPPAKPILIPFKQLKPAILASLSTESLLPNLSLSLERLGNLRLFQNRHKESEAAYRAAFDLRELIVLYGGPNPVNLGFLGRSHFEIANCEARNKQPDKAEFHFRKAIDILTGLEEQYPEWTVYRSAIANGQWQLAKFLVRQGITQSANRQSRYSQAEVLYRQALDRFLTLQKSTTGVNYYRRALSTTYSDLAYVKYLQGHSADTYHFVRQSIAAEVFFLDAYYNYAWYLVADLKKHLIQFEPQQQGRYAKHSRPWSGASLSYARAIFSGSQSPSPAHVRGGMRPQPKWLKVTLGLIAWKLNQPVSAVKHLVRDFGERGVLTLIIGHIFSPPF